MIEFDYSTNFKADCHQLKIPLYSPIINHQLIDEITVMIDTEYSTTDGIFRVKLVQAGSYEIKPGLIYIWDETDFNSDFIVHDNLFKALHNKNELSFNKIESNNIDWYELFDELENYINTELEVIGAKRRRKILNQLKETEYVQEKLSLLGLKPSSIGIFKDYSANEDYYLSVPQLKIRWSAFFNHVDIFNCVGANFHDGLKQLCFISQRLVKTKGKQWFNDDLYQINGLTYKPYLELHDLSTVLQIPSIRSLDTLASALTNNYIKKDDILGNLEIQSTCKNLGIPIENAKSYMDILYEENPKVILDYAAKDVYLLNIIYAIQLKFFNEIRLDCGLEPVKNLKFTTGSNVSNFLYDYIQKYFDSDLVNLRRKDNLLTKSHIKQLQNLDLNRHGSQGLLTVGGLLYTRCAITPIIDGLLADIDLASAYATAITKLNIYIGEPITLAWKKSDKRIKLKDALSYFESECYHDSWFLRVSGTLDKATNTLIYSDSNFKQLRKSVNQPNFSADILNWNMGRTSKDFADSKLYQKEIKYGVITKATIEALRKLPDNLLEEFLNLELDFACYIPKNLIVDNHFEWASVSKTLEYENTKLNVDFKSNHISLDFQPSKYNVCLRFPLSSFASELKSKRKELKKAKNPVQEYYKLILNCIYGILACTQLKTNNPLAANQITAMVRATAWLFMNGFNGFQLITDGCTFNLNTVPFNQSFHDILELYPDYLIRYNSDFNSTPLNNYNSLNPVELSEKVKGLEPSLKSHLFLFYKADKQDYLLSAFEGELKSEKFFKLDGNSQDIFYFEKFINHGSGNYTKLLNNGSSIVIDDSQGHLLEIDRESFKVKARGFKSDLRLLEWYELVLSDRGLYKPEIFLSNHIIKFSESLKILVRLLKQKENKNAEIAFPCGKSMYEAKIMKLITSSQFLFLTERQRNNYLKNLEKLGKLSQKYLVTLKSVEKILESPLFIELLSATNYLNKPKVESMVDNGRLFNYIDNHPTGLGFEILAFGDTFKGSVLEVRKKLFELIQSGCINFNAKLNLDRTITSIIKKNPIILATFVLRGFIKSNEDDRLTYLLKNTDSSLTIKFKYSDLTIEQLNAIDNDFDL